jgi:hypothetical protein
VSACTGAWQVLAVQVLGRLLPAGGGQHCQYLCLAAATGEQLQMIFFGAVAHLVFK